LGNHGRARGQPGIEVLSQHDGAPTQLGAYQLFVGHFFVEKRQRAVAKAPAVPAAYRRVCERRLSGRRAASWWGPHCCPSVASSPPVSPASGARAPLSVLTALLIWSARRALVGVGSWASFMA